MDYELSKSLMDAGFPQIGKGRLIGPPNKFVWRSGDRVYARTLEELIEACGKNFGSLDRRHGGWLTSANSNQSCLAETPAEAVARLWGAMACGPSPSASKINLMLSLSHRQLQIVMDAARGLPVEKRTIFLERIGAMLELRGLVNDADVSDVAALALVGLVHQKTDAA